MGRWGYEKIGISIPFILIPLIPTLSARIEETPDPLH
jgi:hypothetical protein